MFGKNRLKRDNNGGKKSFLLYYQDAVLIYSSELDGMRWRL